MLHRLVATLFFLAAPGCALVQVGATNPIPGLSTVAVAPFFNLSQEPVVDGRRFALAYFAELQQVPGFQVMPVGVVEQAIRDHNLEMNNPEDVLRLAQLLDVDAVVVGAVTDYDPYYPPRVGLQVSWYSDKPWSFYPGIPVDPKARKRWDETHHFPIPLVGSWLDWSEECDDCELHTGSAINHPVPQQATDGPVDENRPAGRDVVRVAASEVATDAELPPGAQSAPRAPSPETVGAPSSPPAITFDPTKPLMSYTRMFDGADANLVARLRDYVELSGDLRSGGWEAYMHRSDDFVRFTAHLMIVEMLTLHGGEAQRRFVFKMRKYK